MYQLQLTWTFYRSFGPLYTKDLQCIKEVAFTTPVTHCQIFLGEPEPKRVLRHVEYKVFLLIYSSHIRNARSPLLNTRSFRNVSSLHVIRHGGGEVGKLPKLDSCTARKENKLLSKESH